jgi:hypothetical protein
VGSQRLFRVTLVCALAFAVSGCMKTDVQVVVMPDGAGKMVVDFDLNPRRLPFFVKDPLSNLTTPRFLAGSMVPGTYAWAQPVRHTTPERDHLVLTAYFKDINAFWFYKSEEGRIDRALAFEFDPARDPQTLHLHPNVEQELQVPLPLPSLRSAGFNMELTPGVLAGLMPLLKPLLADMAIVLRVVAPGAVQQASGFTRLEGRFAAIDVDREAFVQMLTERAGVVVDEEALRVADPAIRWTGNAVDGDQRARFHDEMKTARTWWVKNRPGQNR